MKHLVRAVLTMIILPVASAVDATTVNVNGTVLTMDPIHTLARAVLVEDARLAAVASKTAVLRHAGNGARFVDLEGRPVLPGLIDRHTHVNRAGWPMHLHATHGASINQYLRVIGENLREEVLRPIDIHRVRATFQHADCVQPASIDHRAHPGFRPGVHTRPLLSDVLRPFFNQMPLRTVADCGGVRVGFGSDAGVIGVYDPFLTLWRAVSGRMFSGEQSISPQRLSRPQVRRASTIHNVFLNHQEKRSAASSPGSSLISWVSTPPS